MPDAEIIVVKYIEAKYWNKKPREYIQVLLIKDITVIIETQKKTIETQQTEKNKNVTKPDIL